MPTPTGLLKAGDKVRHKESGRVMVVVRREGNDAIYSVILKPADGQPLPKNIYNTVYGEPGCFRLLETAYWLGRTWELVP